MAITDFRGEYRWLSNFEESHIDIINPFLGKEMEAPTVEHAYQAFKTLDLAQRFWVLDSPTPRIAQKRGQKVSLRLNWNSMRRMYMRALVEAKFKQNPILKEKLLLTDKQHLVEGNTWRDTYWGVCNGVGLNHLGRILMDTREELKDSK